MAIAAATVVEAIAIRRKQLFILLMVGAVCLGTSQSVQAQCTAKNEAFQSGEHVMYDLYFNWKFIWKKVGLASLTTNATTYHSEPAFRFNLLCVGSKKTDFFFKMRDTLTCYVSDRLEPLYFRKAAEEGSRHTVDEAWFSYSDGLANVKQRRTWHNPVREAQEMEYSDSRCIFDMLSILAQARSYDPKDYKVGQKILFPIYFNWKFIWKKVGLASLTTNATTYHSEPAFRFNLLCVGSKKTDFFFKMRDTLTCYVSDRLEPLYFRKAAEEGSRHTVDEAWFSYSDGLANVKQRRTWHNPVREAQEMEYSDSRCIFDMLSILAQARSYDPKDYKVGQKILFPMATGRRVEEQTLIYRGKEEVKANNDTVYRCLVFSFVEYKKGKEKEVITFFVSDDKNHLPIRLDMYLNFGSAKAFFKSVRGNRYPMTSVVRKK